MGALELRRQRAGLINTARTELVDVAEAEDRDFTAEEKTRYDLLMSEADKLKTRYERLEEQERVEDGLTDGIAHEGDSMNEEERAESIEFESIQIPEDWQERREWSRLAETTKPEYRQAFNRWVQTGQWDQRALQVDVSTAGGYLLPPMQFVDRLIKNVDNMVYMRQWATRFSVPTAESMGAPSLAADPADPIWTAEIGTGDEDSTMSFGRRELYPHPLAKRIKVSKTMLRKVPSGETLVRDRLGYKFSVTMENAYLNGNGSNQPLGIFTASADGIPTGRDVSTDNSTTAMTTDGLINAKYTLKGQYWGNARWMFHRDAVKMIAKLKDGDGQYLWRESVRAGEPDQLLGVPVFTSEYVPNTFTTGLYVGVLGDFSNYWIVDALDVQIQRLVELYAATNQDGFIGRMESDGAPVVSEAFVRVTLA